MKCFSSGFFYVAEKRELFFEIFVLLYAVLVNLIEIMDGIDDENTFLLDDELHSDTDTDISSNYLDYSSDDSCIFNNILSFPFSGSMWILTGSRSAILLLSNGHKVGDNTGVAVFEKHIAGYEIANTLAKHGAVQHLNSLAPLIYAELQSSYNRYK
ncbi:uncharacterized protein NPIL_185971 [Nephila pilipes]|uniref:Uncharacterized protein n=1 Tax=Nephila pilipes TaxID=299642 RepID=A0A8X6Q3I3_NEPPI|nr:uncharacterized protein NPIL_185971 [Nephila pilipes]